VLNNRFISSSVFPSGAENAAEPTKNWRDHGDVKPLEKIETYVRHVYSHNDQGQPRRSRRLYLVVSSGEFIY